MSPSKEGDGWSFGETQLRGGPSLSDANSIAKTILCDIRDNGVSRIRLKDNIGKCSVRELSAFVRSVCHNLGYLLPQTYKNNRISLIRDEGGDYAKHSVRGHETSAALPFHSDRCDVSVLLYVTPALKGGRVSVVSYEASARYLAKRDAAALSTLCTGVPFDLREERLFDEPRWLVRPVIWETPNGVRGHYIRRFVSDSQRHEDCPRLSSEQVSALDAYDGVLESMREANSFSPQPGDLLVLDNYRVAHAREAFQDCDDSPGRLAIRAWVAPIESEQLPDFMESAVGATRAGCVRGGIGRSKRFKQLLGRDVPCLRGVRK